MGLSLLKHAVCVSNGRRMACEDRWIGEDEKRDVRSLESVRLGLLRGVPPRG